jgi:Nucleotidyl transferase AbiEii toxin, Type IV TA system
MPFRRSPQQTVEHFHLQFSRLFFAGRDRAQFAIKGGCNLRFFFGSIRYSEDLDVDVMGSAVPVYALKDRVSKLLGSAPLKTALQSDGIRLARVSMPKQTETTQRWKLMLEAEDHALPLNTKIEFSRRALGETAQVAPITPGIAREHGLLVFVAQHYPIRTAIEQKVRALVGRPSTQARDVFDLAVLFSLPGGDVDALREVRELAPAAIDRAASVSYRDYTAQVVAYLVRDQAASHGTEETWNAIQLGVIRTLEEGART